jgi:ATP-binding cassette, subfamily G (WHITE), member 2, PDR
MHILIPDQDSQRPIVERHVSFAFYHAYSEAIAGIVADIPVKFVIATVFNVILYFLGGLRYKPSNFFIFFLFTFITMWVSEAVTVFIDVLMRFRLTMSAIFRTLAAATKTISQALALAGVMVLAIVIYTGFTIQRSYMSVLRFLKCLAIHSLSTGTRGSNGSHGLTPSPTRSKAS